MQQAESIEQNANGSRAASQQEIEDLCRRAFLLEDGYGPSSHRELYRTFRDGFYAAWMMAASQPQEP